MENYGLDLHCEMLLEEYRNKLPLYKHLQQVVTDLLQKRIMKTGLEVNSMESRIKAEPSLAGKLQLKGNKYQSLADITDIFGIRIIMFYNEDVDRIASLAETLFDIDWPNSVDKRKQHEFDKLRLQFTALHLLVTQVRLLRQRPSGAQPYAFRTSDAHSLAARLVSHPARHWLQERDRNSFGVPSQLESSGRYA